MSTITTNPYTLYRALSEKDEQLREMFGDIDRLDHPARKSFEGAKVFFDGLSEHLPVMHRNHIDMGLAAVKAEDVEGAMLHLARAEECRLLRQSISALRK